jgi:autotransporter-associated beta strand protein
LVFPAALRRTNTNNITGLTAVSIQFTASGYGISGAAITLAGDTTIATTYATGDSFLDFDLNQQPVLVGPVAHFNHVYNVAGDVSAHLQLRGRITGHPTLNTLHKQGTGSLLLDNRARNNDYGGATQIDAGTLFQEQDFNVPITSAVNVAAGAQFFVENFVWARIGSLAGTGRVYIDNFGRLWTGSNDSSTTFSGSFVLGGEFVKEGSGVLTLSGVSEGLDSRTTVSQGTLQVGNDFAIPRTSVTVTAGATLDLQFWGDRIGSLAGAGNVINHGGLLWTGSDNSSTTFSGVMSGNSGRLVKEGTGVFTLSGANTYTGMTTISAGTLLVNGSQPASPVTIDAGAVLGGSGTVGIVTAAGTVSPGSPSPGVLTIGGNATFNSGSSVRVRLNGTSAGTGYDQVNVSGRVDLSGAPTLAASLGFASAIGDTFAILTSSGGVSGTFNGLPDGTVFTLGTSRFQISYTGTSVVLTHIADPADHFLISAPASATSGVPFDITVTALDPGNNTDTVYTGTVTFSSSDTDPSVVLPTDYTFTAADGGVHTFTDTGLGETTLITPGDQSITATDTASGITGMATVTVTPGPFGPSRGEVISFSTLIASLVTQPGAAQVTQLTPATAAEASAAPLSAAAKHDAAARDLFFAAVASDQHLLESFDLLDTADRGWPSADLL